MVDNILTVPTAASALRTAQHSTAQHVDQPCKLLAKAVPRELPWPCTSPGFRVWVRVEVRRGMHESQVVAAPHQQHPQPVSRSVHHKARNVCEDKCA
jgi:hypothetical protein